MNDFCKVFGVNKAKKELVEQKWWQKYATFGLVDTRVFGILGDKKVVF